MHEPFDSADRQAERAGKSIFVACGSVGVGFCEGFLLLDRRMQETNDGDDRDKSGTTAVMALLTPHHIIFANLGMNFGLLVFMHSLCSR